MAIKTILLTACCLCCFIVSAMAQGPPPDDMGVREFDEVVLVVKPKIVHKGFFRRNPDHSLAKNSTGKIMFKIEVGRSKGQTMFLTADEILTKRYMQTDEEVFRKRLKKDLRGSRIQIPTYERRADEALTKNFIDIAEELSREIVRLDPTYIKGYQRLGTLLRNRFKFDDEMRLYRQGLGAGVVNKEVLWTRMGSLLVKIGLPEAAETEYLRALDESPKYVQGLLGYGRLLVLMRSYAKARELLKDAVSYAFTPSEKGECQIVFGDILLKLGDIDGAKKQFEDATFNLPESPMAKVSLGSVLYLQSETARAKEIFMEVLGVSVLGATEEPGEGEPGEEGTEGEEGEDDTEGEEEDDTEGEEEDDTEGEEEGEDENGEEEEEVFTEFSPFKSHVCLNLALCLIREDDVENARHYIDQAAGIDPTSPRPHALKGYLFEREGDFDAAMEAYRAGLEVDPTNAYCHYAVSQILLGRDDLEGADQSFQAAIRQDHTFSDAFFKRGIIAIRQDRSKEALQFLEHALALAPGSVSRKVALGVAAIGAGDFKKAKAAFADVLTLDAEHLLAKVGEIFLLYYKPKWETEARERLRMLLEDRDNIPPEVKSYVKHIIYLIEENMGKARWFDAFDRPDAFSVGRKWEENKRFGISVRLREGRVVFSGEQKNPGETILETPRAASELVKFELDLRISNFVSFHAGIRVVHRMSGRRRRGDIRAGLFFGRSDKNKLIYGAWDPQFKRWKTIKELGDWPVTENGAMKTNRLGIEFVKVVDGNTESFRIQFLLDGKPVDEGFVHDRFKRLPSSGDLWVGVYAWSSLGQKVEFTVDNASIVIWKKE
jgi:tetratricopeptide (TPR) repeat protein